MPMLAVVAPVCFAGQLTYTCRFISSFMCTDLKTVFKVISELCNSPDFNPVAPASECHVDFVSATVCSYEQVQELSPATPQKIQDIFASMQSDLLRIISRWEQSGQGEGGMDEVDDENAGISLSCTSSVSEDNGGQYQHSSLARRPARALQTRAAFLNGRPSYLLYFWEVADRHQLLQSSLKCLSNGIAACDASCAVSTAPSSDGASSRGRRNRKCGRQDDTDNDEEPFDVSSSSCQVNSRTYSMQATAF